MRLIPSAACLLLLAWPARPVEACDWLPLEVVLASPNEVAVFSICCEEFTVELDGVEVPGTRNTVVVGPFFDGAGSPPYYSVWVPASPLDPTQIYTIVAEGGGADTFEPTAEPVGNTPAGDVSWDFSNALVPVDGPYCCYRRGDSCGGPSVCASDRENRVAVISAAVQSPNPAFVFRIADTDLYPGQRGASRRYSEPADDYTATLEAVDLRTGEVTVLDDTTYAADPSVDYGIRDVELDAIDLGRAYCPSPPSPERCYNGGSPTECPAGSDSVRAAWCEQNQDCRDSGDDACQFFASFCPAPGPEPEPEPEPEAPTDSNGGCATAPEAPLAAYFIVAALAWRSRRRRRASGR